MSTSAPGRTRSGILVALSVVLGLSAAPARAELPGFEPANLLLGLVVEATTDADGDGTFTEREEVHGANATVPLRVTVANSSDVAVTVTAVHGVMDVTTLDLLEAPYCPALAVELAPAATSSCTFTLDRYLHTYTRPPRDELVNVVEVTAIHGEQSVTARAQSTVVNLNAGQVSVALALANDADGDGEFAAVGEAAMAGRAVPFAATVSNTSPGSAVITHLVATTDGQEEPRDLLEHCPALDGMKLRGVGGGHGEDGHDDGHDDDGHDDDGGHEEEGHEGGGGRPTSVTCSFVLDGHSPTPGTSRTTTASVTLAKAHTPEATATTTASSTVSTAATIVVPRTAGVTIAARVGPVGGPYGDHDAEPGLAVAIPATGTQVAYELEVVNTGAATLGSLTLQGWPLDPTTCPTPVLLAPGSSFRCVVGPAPATVGPNLQEVTVRAVGAGQSVRDSDAAWYVGLAEKAPVVDEPVTDDPVTDDPVVDDPVPAPVEDTVGVLPETQHPPAAAPVVTTPETEPSPPTLPRTGAEAVLLLLAGTAGLGVGSELVRVAKRRRRRRRPAAAVDGRRNG